MLLSFLGNSTSQTLRTTRQVYTVDTLCILPAVGYIAWQDKKR